MKIDEYIKLLPKADIKPVNLIHGEEYYLVRALLDKLKSLYRVRVLWGDELTLQELLRELTSMAIFSKEEVFFIFKGEEILKEGKGATSLIKGLSRLGKNRVFFYIDHKLSDKDLKKEPFATIGELGEVISANKLDKKRVKSLVLNKLQKEGISIEEDALEYLLNSTSYDLTTLKVETDKIILFGSKRVDLQEVKKIVLAQGEFNIFDFLDAFYTKDWDRALLSLDELTRKGVPALQIFAVLANYAIKLYTVKELQEWEMPIERALSEVDVKHPLMVANFKRYLSKYNLKELLFLIDRLHYLDFSLKIFYAEPEASLRNFVVEYTLNEKGTYQKRDKRNQD
jgi:DNA polymerase-3 subunit delta